MPSTIQPLAYPGADLPAGSVNQSPAYLKDVWTYNPNTFFRSWRQWLSAEGLYLMCVVTNAAYCRSRPELVEPLRAFLGAGDTQFFSSVNPLTPDVLAFRWPDKILLCVAGTTNLAQWLNDIYAVDQVQDMDGVDGKAFAAFRTCGEGLYGLVGEYVRGNSGLIYITGHSLGGVGGWLLARRLAIKQARRIGNVWSYGAPRPGDADLKRLQGRDGAMVRVAIDVDPVANVPPKYFLRQAVVGGVPTPLRVPCRYFHPQAAQVGLSHRYLPIRAVVGSDDDLFAVDPISALARCLNSGNISAYHAIARYLALLEFYNNFTDQPNLQALKVISQAMVGAGL